MTFLIFVAAFIVLACLVLPLTTLVIFAVMRGDSPEPRPAAPRARAPAASRPRQTVIT